MMGMRLGGSLRQALLASLGGNSDPRLESVQRAGSLHTLLTVLARSKVDVTSNR
jgi:hypothetical protein